MEYLELDPTTVRIAANVREAVVDEDLWASVKENGVRLPVLARRGPDGEVEVIDGQLRTLAAIDGKQILPAVISDGDMDEAARIADQLMLNDRRRDLTTEERMAGWEQLAAFGMKATDIAQRTGEKQQVIVTGLKVAAAPAARKAADDYALTIEQAAVFAEFEDDQPAVKKLRQTVENKQSLTHAAQALRDDREWEANQAKALADLKAAGTGVVEYKWDAGHRHLSELETADGKNLTAKNHAGCQGRRVYVQRRGTTAEIRELCVEAKAAGHRKRGGRPIDGGGALTDEEKAERAEARVNNAAWRSAEKVRRKWLKEFLRRKSAPKDAAAVIAIGILQGGRALRRAMDTDNRFARELLGVETYGDPDPIVALTINLTPGRAQILAAGTLLCAYEALTDTHCWRTPTDMEQFYFATIESWGYELSPIERRCLPSEQ